MEDYRNLLKKLGSSAAAVAVTESSKQLYTAAIEAAIKWPGPSAALFAAAVGGSLFAVVSYPYSQIFILTYNYFNLTIIPFILLLLPLSYLGFSCIWPYKSNKQK